MTSSPDAVHRYDYAIVRVVPRVERGEFMNVGVIVLCSRSRFLSCAFECDQERLRALDPTLDTEMLEASLRAFQSACPGAESDARSLRQAFDFLVAARSAVLQVSPVHSGIGKNMETVLEDLMKRFVRVPRPTSRPDSIAP